MSSAAGVSGPFAPSTITFAFTSAAFSSVTTCSSAHGAKTSQSSVMSSSLVMRSPPFNSESEPPERLCANAAATSMPFALCTPPVESEIATTRGAELADELGEERADVAEALHGDADPVHRTALLLEGRLEAEDPAARGRLLAAERPADRQRLAGDDTQHRVTLVHRVRVEDPRHRRGVRPDVRRRDVLLRADLVDDLRGVPARHALELAARHLLRVAAHAALRPTERKPHQRALPRHPHRERLDLVERDVRVVADAALRRAPRDVVRDPEALERANGAVVEGGRDRDLDGLLALLQHVDEPLVDPECVGDLVELLLSEPERVLAQVRLGGHGGHRGPSLLHPERDLRAVRLRVQRQRRPRSEPQLVGAGRAGGRSSARDP